MGFIIRIGEQQVDPKEVQGTSQWPTPYTATKFKDLLVHFNICGSLFHTFYK